jgi:hypothetical protein
LVVVCAAHTKAGWFTVFALNFYDVTGKSLDFVSRVFPCHRAISGEIFAVVLDKLLTHERIGGNLEAKMLEVAFGSHWNELSAQELYHTFPFFGNSWEVEWSGVDRLIRGRGSGFEGWRRNR